MDYLVRLLPELADFDLIAGETSSVSHHAADDAEEIVEVRGSSACFEYQFPASPEYFVGRQQALTELDSFVADVLERNTSARGILFEANSGWGKSSLVLASVNRLRQMGHLAFAIDSRSASSSQFILRVTDYVIRQCSTLLTSPETEIGALQPISGFDGAVQAILQIGHCLESTKKLLFVFLDQFENVFFLQDALRYIRDLFLKVCDAQSNVICGFSWKTDLIGLTSEFPYQQRDAITASSKRISLGTFSEVETTALLDRLSQEVRAPLRKDLTFFLSEFSQGYPWLLKKLCAHVKAQRSAGVPQLDIANSLLNIEELFQEDLRGLSPEEEDALRQIAKAASISVLELGEEFRPEVVQSLVNARLVVRIGNKYDVYWDIFRDYLNTGLTPVQENYIPRMQVGSVLNATRLLAEAGGSLITSAFQSKAGLSEKSFYNVARDMRLLGLVRVQDEKVILQAGVPRQTKGFEESLRTYLRERLQRNRLVQRLVKSLATEELSVDKVASVLSQACPYISAAEDTWRTYALVFVGWMDFTDLAILDIKQGRVSRYTPGGIRKRRSFEGRSRSGVAVPRLQYSPIEKALMVIVEADTQGEEVDWSDFKATTKTKAIAALQDLGFISRKGEQLIVHKIARQVARNPAKRIAVFAEKALEMDAFAQFIQILESNKDDGLSLAELAANLKATLGVEWKDGTGETTVKIMLDWARHLKLAPGSFAINRRRKGT